jgi:hypothetical protein
VLSSLGLWLSAWLQAGKLLQAASAPTVSGDLLPVKKQATCLWVVSASIACSSASAVTQPSHSAHLPKVAAYADNISLTHGANRSLPLPFTQKVQILQPMAAVLTASSASLQGDPAPHVEAPPKGCPDSPQYDDADDDHAAVTAAKASAWEPVRLGTTRNKLRV